MISFPNDRGVGAVWNRLIPIGEEPVAGPGSIPRADDGPGVNSTGESMPLRSYLWSFMSIKLRPGKTRMARTS